ncbi:MAG: putative bifunctional diguanylate cyclase/phosphodiesterase, partial [Actinomycetota bacterium]
YQARHDSLTGLMNRTHFTSLLEGALTEEAGSCGVFLMDLDYFKEINDTLGHHTGDVDLVEVAARQRSGLREDTAVARLGGDEFGILVPGLDAGAAEVVAERINSALTEQLNVAGMSLELGCSVGIALYPSHGTDATTLLQRADVAMYLAKEERGGYALYSEERDRYTSDRLALIGELRTAIAERQLTVWYQPKVDLVDDRAVGAEALVRWEHPRLGMVQPDEFVGLAEHTGLIGPLTDLVLDIALQDCRRWRASGRPDFTVSVNLSARSLLDAQIPETVRQLLARHGLPPDCLLLEITESSIMSDPQRASAILSRLDAMGVQLSIDDFGTGYSSFAYLRDLPISEIKIDRSFVFSMTNEESDALIVRSIIDLGRNLQLRVVAEGVEDERTRRSLAGLGCRLGQGYLMSRPKPALQLTQWLESRGESLSNVVELPTG